MWNDLRFIFRVYMSGKTSIKNFEEIDVRNK